MPLNKQKKGPFMATKSIKDTDLPLKWPRNDVTWQPMDSLKTMSLQVQGLAPLMKNKCNTIKRVYMILQMLKHLYKALRYKHTELPLKLIKRC